MRLGLNVRTPTRLKGQSRGSLDELGLRIAEQEEVTACRLMNGNIGNLIRVALTDIAALEQFILKKLTPTPDIEEICSSVALEQRHYETTLPLPSARA